MIYFEDIFLKFYDAVKHDIRFWPRTEQNAILNFYRIISSNNQLTEKQANFVIRLIEKYKDVSSLNKYTVDDLLENAVWKYEFRTIDYSKKVFVEETEDGPVICLKCPFNFKQTVETLLKNSLHYFQNSWDKDRKINVLNPYEINLLDFQEFCRTNEFEIDISFENLVAEYEEILNQEESLYPGFIVDDCEIILKNCNEDVHNFYNENKTSSLKNNLILLKTMGIVQLNNNSKDMFSVLTASDTNQFYINELVRYFELVEHVNNKAVIVLYDDEHILKWLKTFYNISLNTNFTKKIKIGFRENADSSINEWIKENELGGKIEEGDVLIFKNKIPKWIFTKNISIDIFSTNDLIPNRNAVIKQMVRHMPIVVHIAEYEPTTWRDHKIVNL